MITDTQMIDLRSDTITRPTRGMREAMANADVGDDVYGEDPTVNGEFWQGLSIIDCGPSTKICNWKIATFQEKQQTFLFSIYVFV